jgi:hypothetical protein
MPIFNPHEGVTEAQADYWVTADFYEDPYAPQATPADAHREWHANAGVPMGQPGCPQDACHPYDDPEEYGPQEPQVKCGYCHQRHGISTVRLHAGI